MTASKQILQRLARGPVILDGSLGMELEKQGFHGRLPLWSAGALIEQSELVRRIHEDYLRAGADVLTTATFRCTRHTLAKVGMGARTQELTNLAVRLAREAIVEAGKGREILVGGSMAPLEDCYKPELAPADEILRREHRANAESLAEAGADLLLVETQNSRREVVIATESALAAGPPVWTSLMPRSSREMFNGDSLIETARQIAEMGVEALLINCCELRIAAQAFAELRRELPTTILGVYPNDLTGIISPKVFADWSMQLRDQAVIHGGCCGIGPEHIRQLCLEIANQRL